MQAIAWPFYVQDERYDAVPWMARSVDVQASSNPELVEGRLLRTQDARGYMDGKERLCSGLVKS